MRPGIINNPFPSLGLSFLFCKVGIPAYFHFWARNPSTSHLMSITVMLNSHHRELTASGKPQRIPEA
jgi:hypothetical protein